MSKDECGVDKTCSNTPMDNDVNHEEAQHQCENIKPVSTSSSSTLSVRPNKLYPDGAVVDSTLN